MVDYKATLRLPKTDFPMRANLPEREPDWLARWEREAIYDEHMKRRAGAAEFHLHDGPPFANGNAHMGHALNMTLKDFVLKSRAMAGFRVPFVPGWDCHGLPIEHKVMKERGATLSDPVEIRRDCAAYARKYVEIQREQFKRLGVFGEWDNPYLTMDPAYEAEILRVFARLVGRGLVYQSLRPVYWSTGCQTALAEAEIEYQDRTDPSIHVEFPIDLDTLPAALPAELRDALKPGDGLLVWTTTPWTLPANVAVAASQSLPYVLATDGTRRGIVAVPLLEALSEASGTGWKAVTAAVPGGTLAGLSYWHPFLERAGRVFTADFVTADTGTGLVHIAPGHGHDDYVLGLREGLPQLSPVDDAGRLTAECGVAEWVGLNVFKANEPIVAHLKQAGRLVARRDYLHSYPHCWRSKTPIIFRSVKQWFIKVDAFRAEALDAIDRVDWVPAWGRQRIRGAVESRPDWCISRQRTWGVPVPVFYAEGQQPLMSEKVILTFADIVEKEGTDAWFSTPDDVLAKRLGLPAGVRKGRDTLDVWIDSGTSHAAVVRKRLRFPADLYLEGSDQHRGWFQSSLLTSVAATGEVPFRQVLTNGFVVDQDREKISKSKEYTVPVDLMTFAGKYGADILRLWVASEDFRNDVPFSEEIFKHVTDTYRKFRDTLRVLLGNLGPGEGSATEPWTAWDPVDRFIVMRLRQLVETCRCAYDRYEFHQVYHAVNRFCRLDLSAFYIDLLKDRMYCDPVTSPRRASSQRAMRLVADTLCRLLAPLTPFTADEAWRTLGHAESVHLSAFPDTSDWPDDATELAAWDQVLSVRDQVNLKLESLRQAKQITRNLDASATVPEGTALGLLDEEQLAEALNVSQVRRLGTEVTVQIASGSKCPRCWRVVEETGSDAAHPELCSRCTGAVAEVAGTPS